MRKMTMGIMTKQNVVRAFSDQSDESFKTGGKKKKKISKTKTVIEEDIHPLGTLPNGEVCYKKDEPHDLELDSDVARPHEEGYVDGKEIKESIDHKRKRVHIEAIHKAEKAKQQTNLYNVAGIARKGGISNTKLRGMNEEDFFQKNNTVDKGFTFNYDGTLVDFKKPKVTKDLEYTAQYEVNNETLVNQALGKNHHKKTQMQTGFGGARLTQTDYGAEKVSEKQAGGTQYSRQNTQKETPHAVDFSTATQWQSMATKQQVIEFA